MDIRQELDQIKERNARVEADKAWETSWTRALVIAAFTYAVAGVWLVVVGDTNPWIKALVPAVGFLLSTFSLPAVRRWWLKIVRP